MNTLLGTWLSIGSPVIAELAADIGFDWLLFDLEHGCGNDAALLPQLQATRGSSVRKIVRVGAPHPDLILRVLDWGADGIMVPHVNTVEEAEHVVKAAHYAPRGHRGFSRTVRAYGYGLRPPDADKLPEPFILAQIETLEGVSNARAIAAVEGVSALFVGPADLNFDIKTRTPVHNAPSSGCKESENSVQCAMPAASLDSPAKNTPGTPEIRLDQTGSNQRILRSYEECLSEVVAAATEAGKPCGILVRNAADLPQYQALGFTWIAIDSDLALLREGFLKLRNQVPAAKESLH